MALGGGGKKIKEIELKNNLIELIDMVLVFVLYEF